MVDLDKGLNDWLDKITKKVKLSTDQKTAITGEGAKTYAEVLKKNTPISHASYAHARSAGHGRKSKHMRDAITYKAGYEVNDGNTGDTSVGWEDKYNALVARFVNDGTRDMSQKEISNLHFKDHAEKEAADAVLKANAEKFREVLDQ